MTFNFPNAPFLGQTHSPITGLTYFWDGTAWKAAASGTTALITIGDVPPAGPKQGQLWWESDTGAMFVWYQDVDSGQWVQVSAAPPSASDTVIHDITVGMNAVSIPADVAALRTFGYYIVGDGGGALYRRVGAEPTHTGKFQTFDGAWWAYCPEGEINGAAFGLDMTGATFSDVAWQGLLNYAKSVFTNPGTRTGWGHSTIKLPKGKIKLQNGWTPGTPGYSVIGFTIEGMGKYATSVEYHNDTDPMFNLGINIAFSLRRMSIWHMPLNADRTTWTNTLVTRSGVGGGNEMHLDEIHTTNFAIIDKITGTTDNDTTHFTYCRIMDCRTMVYARSSQSLINKFDHCTIGGKTERMLDIAGYGHTVCDTCNIVIDGTWLHLENASALYGTTAIFTFKNCKGEPWNSTALPAGSVSQLITKSGDGSFIGADVHFKQCGFASAATMDPAIYQMNISPGIRVHCKGGGMPFVKVRSSPLSVGSEALLRNQRGILFEDMRSPPSPANVSLVAGTLGLGNTSITWRNCVAFHNMTACVQNSAGHLARQTSRLQYAAGHTLMPGTTGTFDMPFYGFVQRVVEVLVHLNNKSGNNLTCDVYSDAARTVLIGQILFTSADNIAGPLCRRLPAAVDKYVTEGLYFSLAHTVAGQAGHILVTLEAAG